MNDYHLPLPRLGRLASLRFAWDPPGLLASGRSLAASKASYHFDVGPFPRPWQFWLAGRLVTVLSDLAALRLPNTRVYRAELLAPLLGEASAYLEDLSKAFDLQGYPAPYRRPAGERGSREHATPRIIREELAAALGWARAGGRPFDLVPALRTAAVRVALRELETPTRFFGQAEEAAKALLRAADTLALVVPELRAPGLRRLTRWPQLAGAREAFLRAVDLKGAFGDFAVTTLVGWADNPVMLAAQALAYLPETLRHAETWATWGWHRPIRSDGLTDAQDAALQLALRHPTVPLALREAADWIELPGDLLMRPGEAFGVDLEAAEATFGAGAHACPMRELGQTFAREVLLAAEDARWSVVPGTLRLGRSRLSWGPVSLLAVP